MFDLPQRLAAKTAPALIADDEAHFAAIAAGLDEAMAEASDRLEAALRAPGGRGQQALDRDQEVHRLTSRLRTLRRFGVDLCLGRMVADANGPGVGDGDGAPVYIGRLGLSDRSGRRLLIDWRSPAAEPFFGATHANPMGLASRRRYRWTRGRITDYWDEVFTADGLAAPGERAALDDQSAFIASLGDARSPRMRDVLGTIQADQDAIIRAGSRGALVVDGGPGTGKTVVALHRTAYLLYTDPRLEHRRGGVLLVGPHRPYLDYVADVLPSLGENGVAMCTLDQLVPEGAAARPEHDPAVARLKSATELTAAIERAVARYEVPPRAGMYVETPWRDLWLDPDDWAEAFTAADAGAAHNEARDEVWEALATSLVDQLAEIVDGEVPGQLLRRAVQQNAELRQAFARAWPLLDPAGVVADLWSNPSYLRQCAPSLSDDEVATLKRDDARAWTTADLPLLDAARARIGDPEASRRRLQADAAVAAERERYERVVEYLVGTQEYDDGEGVMTMLRGSDLQNTLVDEAGLRRVDPDEFAGPFAHIVVDEAQELSDAEWLMLLRRCPSRSFTIVGDRAQARHGFHLAWAERLERVGLDRVEIASLTINYRTPAEVMAEAEPVIRAALPDANVPTSVRSSGLPVVHGSLGSLRSTLERWLADHDDGVACVITRDPDGLPDASLPASPRIRVLTPELAKGLEFDLVVLVDPERFESAVDRYVAMTRATRQLIVLGSE